jgi:hypothetical protein
MLLSFGLCTQQQALGCGLDQNTDLHSALHAPHAGPCFSKACQRTTLLAESATKATCRIFVEENTCAAGGGRDFLLLFFGPPLVPNVFPCGSPSSQVVPQDIPNSTLDLSHMVCPNSNSHVYKLKR